MSNHAFINVIIPFEREYAGAVEKVLRSFTDASTGNRPCKSVATPIDESGVIHFMSMTVVDPRCPSERDDPTTTTGPAHLLIEISSDCGAEETLLLLANKLGPELWQVLSAANVEVCQKPLAEYLLDHNKVIDATWHAGALGQVFTGSPGMTVQRIRSEEYLAASIRRLIEQYRASGEPSGHRPGWYESSPRQRIERIRDELWENWEPVDGQEASIKWAFVPEAAPCLAGDPHNDWDDKSSLGNQQYWKAAFSVVGTLLWPLFLPFALLALLAVVFVGWHFEHVGVGQVVGGLLLAGIALKAAVSAVQFGYRALLVVAMVLAFAGWKEGAFLDSTWIAHAIVGLFIGLFVLVEAVFKEYRWWLYPLLSVLAALLLLWLMQLIWIGIVIVGLLIGFAVAVALVIGVAVWRLLQLAKTDLVEDLTPPPEQVAALMRVENFCAQNHLASISRLKGGLLHRLALRLAFIVVGTGRFVCPPGLLGKNGVIHFARWMVLPGTDQMLFWSNYDNTWQSYVGDFIADAPTGVTGIWSNCVGFPKTEKLIFGGAMDRDRLVRWARRQQHCTTFWYSAYPNLTADRIRINAAIRQGFASAESNEDVRDWFALFGSKPAPADTLQLQQMPTLLLGGLSSMRFSRCHLFSIQDAQEGRRWLRALTSLATYGEVLPGQKSAVVIAFTAQGLLTLGLPEEAVRTFPAAFQQGMWPDYRARMLGDIEENAPENWDWGRREAIHVLLMTYGVEGLDLSAVEASIRPTSNLIREVKGSPIFLSPLADKAAGRVHGRERYAKEPFGFVDGVSQPVIRGSSRSRANVCPNDLVAAGELVLGYEDDLGRIPPSPSIADEYDPDHILPDAGPDPLRRRPEFSRYEGTGRRDLGANGTFLVVRQLAQDAGKFEAWLDEAVNQIKYDVVVAADLSQRSDSADSMAEDCPAGGSASAEGRIAIVWGTQADAAPLPGPPARHLLNVVQKIDWTNPIHRRKVRDYIAAKLVGRWKDGTSLVRHTLMPGSEQRPPEDPDNDFLLGKEDPSGFGCPFGAHIRRANPRDTRFPGSKEEVATTNRHRILRVGRTYAGKADEKAQGLLFMCLNADIERQFEFIQKTWLMNPNVHGLESEVDPILGRGNRQLTIPTPTGPIRLRIDRQFVRVQGGGYFFLPGRAVLRFLAARA